MTLTVPSPPPVPAPPYNFQFHSSCLNSKLPSSSLSQSPEVETTPVSSNDLPPLPFAQSLTASEAPTFASSPPSIRLPLPICVSHLPRRRRTSIRPSVRPPRHLFARPSVRSFVPCVFRAARARGVAPYVPLCHSFFFF